MAKDLTKLLLDHQALRFGDFTLKSGAKSPYFVDLGAIHSGDGFGKLCKLFADEIAQTFDQTIETIIGPAYKGIPLCSGIAATLAAAGWKVGFTYNRKERKTHGGDSHGSWVGIENLKNKKAVIVDDVFTTGGTKAELLSQLQGSDWQVDVVGMVVAVDRMQPKAKGGEIFQEFCAHHQIKGLALANMDEILNVLENDDLLDKTSISRVRDFIGSGD